MKNIIKSTTVNYPNKTNVDMDYSRPVYLANAELVCNNFISGLQQLCTLIEVGARY